MHQLHQKYGDVVRYGPNRIAINTPTALHEIYSVRSSVQKSSLYTVFQRFFKVASSGSLIDKAEHGSRRRIIGQIVTVPVLKSMEVFILDNVQRFCEQLAGADFEVRDGEWSPGRDMTDWIARMAIDNIAGLLFGQAWIKLDVGSKREFLASIPAGTKGFLMGGHMPAILTFRLERIFLREVTSRARKFESVTKAQLEARLARYRASEVKENDMFEKLIEAQNSSTGASLTMPDMQAETMVIMVAGYDTMATTLTATIFHLLHNPSTLTRLRTELDRTFSSATAIVIGPKLNTCTYLRACLDESLRLNPPVGGVLPREVLHRGLTINNNFFPPGTDIGVSLYALQRQEKYFTSPEVYEPARWAGGEGFTATTEAFAPFSLGPRGCPAKGMAYAEMMVVLARMVFLLEMRLVPGSELVEQKPARFMTKDFFVSTHEGPVVQFRRRERAW
ncbi:MAG: hypothetical protein Q9195_006654 [Heterodermia aff. obscurata]